MIRVHDHFAPWRGLMRFYDPAPKSYDMAALTALVEENDRHDHRYCSAFGCLERARVKGYCIPHYQRVMRTGSTETAEHFCPDCKAKGKYTATPLGGRCAKHRREQNTREYRAWKERNQVRTLRVRHPANETAKHARALALHQCPNPPVDKCPNLP